MINEAYIKKKGMASHLSERILLENNNNFELTEVEEKLAKDNSLVIAYVDSNNLVKLKGAKDYSIEIDKETLLCKKSFCNAPSYFDIVVNKNEKEDYWFFETKIKHELFNIYNKDILCCKGIIFSLYDI